MTSRARYDLSGEPSVTRVEVGPESLDDPSKYTAVYKTGTSARVGKADTEMAKAV